VCSGIRGKGVFAREGQQGLGKEGGREEGREGGREGERACVRVCELRFYMRCMKECTCAAAESTGARAESALGSLSARAGGASRPGASHFLQLAYVPAP